MSRVTIQFDPQGEVTEYKLAPSQAAYLRGIRAIMLAPTIQLYDALMAGENVPVDLLDPKWVDRYGLRKDAA